MAELCSLVEHQYFSQLYKDQQALNESFDVTED